MKRSIYLMLILLAGSIAVGAVSLSGQGHAGHGQAAGKPATSSPYDLQFLDTMTEHHQHGLEMAKLAVEKASHAELKTLAQKMMSDQQKEINQMKGWRDQWYAGQPKSVNMNMPGMSHHMDMSKLQAASGHEFDMMFLDMMIPHHQGAIDMSRDALRKAQHPEVKTLARQAISKQQKEKQTMTKWKSAWGSGAHGKGAMKH
jgi:uncharacterized protein (DUF305 family)